MREIIKEIILEFYKSDLPNVFHRIVEIPQLPKGVRKALVFIGMRRVGKTYMMYQHMQSQISQELPKEKLLYINFEDDRLEGFSAHDFQTILDIYYELYPQYAHADDLVFYFDEIQNILGWDKFIRRLIDKEKMSIFITGSSAKLLSKEIATSLRGRCLENEVFPLSFKEYLHYYGISDFHNLTSKEKAIIKHHVLNYLQKGGFPEILTLPDSLYYQTIQSYVNVAVFRDVIERHQLSNTHQVKLFLNHCLQNITSPLSVTKIYKTFKSRGEVLGRSNLYAYLHYFEDAYLIHSVPIFDLSARKRQVNPSKIYCADAGIIMSYSIKPHTENSACLENAVYIHLRKMGFENIFYYKTTTGKEVDFVAQHSNGAIELYQVCVDIGDPKTKQREISALLEAAQELEVKEANIITVDACETIQIESVTIHIQSYAQLVL